MQLDSKDASIADDKMLVVTIYIWLDIPLFQYHISPCHSLSRIASQLVDIWIFDGQKLCLFEP